MSEITEIWYVSLYLCNMAFGGSEEGGWWYVVGEYINDSDLNKMFTDHESALAYKDSDEVKEVLKIMNEGGYGISSVLSDGEYEMCVEDEFPHSFPIERPHYE